MAFGLAFAEVTPVVTRRRTASLRCAQRGAPVRPRTVHMSAPQPAAMDTSEACVPLADKPLHVRTPLHESAAFSERAGARVLLKMDTQQPAGSFKIRGVGLRCVRAAARGARHLVCSSGGNAGAAVAHAGAALGLRTTIVVPTSTPGFMLARLRAAGAEVRVEGDVWDVADAHARKIVAATPGGGAVHVHPFDHPDLWEGHASLVHELADDLHGRPPAAIVVSVGGGGLFLGVAQGCREVGWDHVPIIAAETRGADSFASMVREGRIVQLPTISSIAKSLGALAVSERCLEWVRDGRAIIPAVVEDRDAVQACVDLAVHHRVLVEPACGAAVAAALQKSKCILARPNSVESNGTPTSAAPEGKTSKEGGPIVIIVCGGNMASPGLLRQWVEATGASMDTDLV